MKRRAFASGLIALLVSSTGAAQSFEYRLKAKQVASGVYVFEGNTEGFSRENGGNIVNTGFIVGSTGVTLIDTGPSRGYAEAAKAAIAEVTSLPVVQVFITHHHPDHFLGNQVWAEVPIAALPATRERIQRDGDELAENLYRLLGGWMRETLPKDPNLDARAGRVIIGGRRLRLLALEGHTAGDLVVVDEKTRTVFAGDLVFFARVPTTPDAKPARWREALRTLVSLRPRHLVPGHGPVHRGDKGIQQTRRYLEWLVFALQKSAERGLSMSEVVPTETPRDFERMGAWPQEFLRSVSHLYPRYEEESLPKIPP